ncbi:MAG: hypothetical protein JWN61_509, partial [Pseudonocardiales bacterium]|nr:hypothetical protein [Pseudonocardiales bacterium]
ALAAERPTLIAHRAGYVASVVDAALASFLVAVPAVAARR